MMQAVRNYCGVVVILVWGLAPFYWMVVTALRDKDHTFDTTPWPTHVTLDNFGDALATDKGNDFLGAIGNSLLVGAVTTSSRCWLVCSPPTPSRVWTSAPRASSPASSSPPPCSPESPWSRHCSSCLATSAGSAPTAH